MKSYPYRRLSLTNQEIRLLLVAPGSWGSDLVCELHHASLGLRPEYEALSYTWGDENKRRDIVIDGFRASVTVNLEVALRHLRLESEPRVLWADAVCINQQDDNEKSKQVQLMLDIFASASKVLAWTGEASYDSDDAMDLISAFWRFLGEIRDDKFEDLFHPIEWEKHGFDPFRRNWMALIRFCERPYWTRIWILQELSSPGLVNGRQENDRCVVFCGRRSIARAHFLEVCIAFQLIMEKRLHPSQEPYRTFLKAMHLNGGHQPPALRIIQLVAEFKLGSEDSRFRTKSLPLMIRLAGHLQATKPQDKIFALLGLCAKRDQLLLQPDYTRPSVDIYIDFVQKFIERDHKLECLLGNRRVGPQKSPSWIPDFEIAANPGSSWSVYGPRLYRPGGDRESRAHVDTINRLLTVQGVRIGVVKNVIRFAQNGTPPKLPQIRAEWGFFTTLLLPITLAFALAQWVLWRLRGIWLLSRLLLLAHSLNEAKQELLWRTLIMDIDRPLIHDLFDLEDIKTPASDRFRDMYKLCFGMHIVQARPGESFRSLYTRNLLLRAEFAVRTEECIRCRCVFLTKCGRIGIGALDTRRDDLVCILFGSPFCFILRPCGPRFKLVGDAYVQGVMRGEFFNTDASRIEEEFVLC